MNDKINFTTREDWLHKGKQLIDTHLFSKIKTTTKEVQISVGFPLGSRGNGNNKTIGQCFIKEVASDNMPHIFITPSIDDASRVLDILSHELIHAYGHKGHGKDFRQVAIGIGLTGKMTATVASDKMKDTFKHWLDNELGKYPHGKLDASMVGRKKQATRLIKVSCSGCGFTMRTTAKWIDRAGNCLLCPICHKPDMITG